MPALSLTDRNIIDSLKNEVHVWFCFPNEIVDTKILDQYHSLLSVDEREKQQRFHFEKDRHSYLVSHALIRSVLSRYCDIEADKLSFEFNEYGKPGIATKHNFPALHFNLSHTDGLCACVVSLGSKCGVDVENINRKSNLLAVSERMFAEPEAELIVASDGIEKQNKFFEFWTLREAYVKAVGTGLGGSSKAFYFTVEEQADDLSELTERFANIHFEKTNTDNGSNDKKWQFSLLSPSAEHVAAIAVSQNADTKKIIVSTLIQP